MAQFQEVRATGSPIYDGILTLFYRSCATQLTPALREFGANQTRAT